jgi:transcriptional regulator with XRE-family HTH domain
MIVRPAACRNLASRQAGEPPGSDHRQADGLLEPSEPSGRRAAGTWRATKQLRRAACGPPVSASKSGTEKIPMNEPWDSQMQALGAFIRSKRKLANLSLRQLAERTKLSNPYLSQIERGLHQPSVRVIRLISDALNLSTETLLAQAGLLHRDTAAAGKPEAAPPDIEAAIKAEQRLSDDQKNALIAVLRSMLPAE